MITGHTENGAYLAKAGSDLTIYCAAESCAQLRLAIETHTSVVLDLSAVSDIDTAGVQILLQARRTCDAHGKYLQFVSPSPAVQDVVRLLRLHDVLDMPRDGQTSPLLQDGTT